jgi:hypothetical protein
LALPTNCRSVKVNQLPYRFYTLLGAVFFIYPPRFCRKVSRPLPLRFVLFSRCVCAVFVTFHCTTITRDSGKLVCPIYAAFKNQTWREIHLAVCLARLFFTRVSWLPNGLAMRSAGLKSTSLSAYRYVR